MSVIVIGRFQGNPADLEAFASGAGADVIRGLGEAARAAGALSHRFVGGHNEILLVDEWTDEESFQKFFANQPDIPGAMQGAGMHGQPEFTVYRPLSTPDQF